MMRAKMEWDSTLKGFRDKFSVTRFVICEKLTGSSVNLLPLKSISRRFRACSIILASKQECHRGSQMRKERKREREENLHSAPGITVNSLMVRLMRRRSERLSYALGVVDAKKETVAPKSSARRESGPHPPKKKRHHPRTYSESSKKFDIRHQRQRKEEEEEEEEGTKQGVRESIFKRKIEK